MPSPHRFSQRVIGCAQCVAGRFARQHPHPLKRREIAAQKLRGFGGNANTPRVDCSIRNRARVVGPAVDHVGVHLRYWYRIYPTAPQRKKLARTFGCVRVVYNDAVAAKQKAYAEGEKYPTYFDLSKKLLTAAKKTPERAWLAEVANVTLQESLRDCDRAYKNFFDSVKGRRAG